MKKIPLHPADKPSTDVAPSSAAPDALEILLLGGIWWYVLILLPLVQHSLLAETLAPWLPQLVKVQGVATATVALVVLLLRQLAGGLVWRQHGREIVLLLALALLGGGLVWQALQGLPSADLHLYGAGLQGILALGYFLARRHGAMSG